MADQALTDRALFDIATLSHVGHARRRNQDFFLVVPECGLSVVADGVGGQGDGGWASRAAIQVFCDRLERHMAPRAAQVCESELLSALEHTHAAMCAQNHASSGKSSGTTIAGIWASDGAKGPVTAFNVGDSSVFHIAQGRIAKISRDHSLYQLWLDGGRAGKEPGRRTITQALGISDRIAPHFTTFAVAPGDRVVICTDGLSGALSQAQMAEIALWTKSSRDMCERLIAAVLEGPASDNATVSVCAF